MQTFTIFLIFITTLIQKIILYALNSHLIHSYLFIKNNINNNNNNYYYYQ